MKKRRARRTVTKAEPECKTCYECGNCQYICEGDFICDVDMTLVVDGWTPTNEFYHCGGKEFVEE